MKNIGELLNFADSVVGGYLNAWGMFTKVFIMLLPLIFLLGGIKWAVNNGFI